MIQSCQAPAKELNGFTYYNKVCDVLKVPDNFWSRHSLNPMDMDCAQKELDDNAEALALLAKGNKCSEYFYPKSTSSEDSPPDFDTWTQISNLLSLKAQYCIEKNEATEALEVIGEQLKFGYRLQKTGVAWMPLFVGYGIIRTGLQNALRLTHSNILNDEQLANLQMMVETSAPSTTGVRNAFMAEYEAASNALSTLIPEEYKRKNALPWQLGPDSEKVIFHPNRTRKLLGDYYSKTIENADRAFIEIDFEEANKTIDQQLKQPEEGNKLKQMMTPNLLGLTFIVTLEVDGTEIQKTRCQIETASSAVSAIIALQRYKRSFGHIPKQLTDLLPQYLDELPRDAFSGGTLKYDASRSIIYSIGKNLIDDGGSAKLLEIVSFVNRYTAGGRPSIIKPIPCPLPKALRAKRKSSIMLRTT